MHWPRGKYNGQRIVGIEIRFKLNITYWLCTASWNYGEPYVFIGPLRIQVSAVYAWDRK
jgi:hypothetical protein